MTPIECKYQIVSTTFLVFVDANENSIMADDIATLSNHLVVPVKEEELEKKSFDVNVSQRSHEEKSSRKVVHTRIDCLAWDHQLFRNPHVLAIYLKFVHARGVMPERFEKCHCENDNVHFHYRTWIPDDGHYHCLRGQINPLSMEH
jgi:hypothetical protein